MLLHVRTIFFILTLWAVSTTHAASTQWEPLEGTWNKLPIACGRDPGSLCGGDRFTLNDGILDARRTCTGVSLVVRARTGDTWQVEVVGKKACVWNSHRVRSFVFTVGPGQDQLWLRAYATAAPSSGAELFQGVGFER